MKINYVSIKKDDKMITIDPINISVNIELSKVKEYYLTPLQAILFGIVQKFDTDNNWVVIPSSINGCFMHLDGGHEINAAFDMLIEKRLLIEGDYLFPFDDSCRVFKLADK